MCVCMFKYNPLPILETNLPKMECYYIVSSLYFSPVRNSILQNPFTFTLGSSRSFKKKCMENDVLLSFLLWKIRTCTIANSQSCCKDQVSKYIPKYSEIYTSFCDRNSTTVNSFIKHRKVTQVGNF